MAALIYTNAGSVLLTMSNQKMLYTIEELSEATGITARTIRYYTTEGLLATPETRGRYALYADTHLRRLQLVVMLKAAYLPLSTIKDRLAHVSNQNVAALTRDEPIDEDEETTEDGESAAAYLQRVLSNRNEMKQTRTPRLPATFPGLRDGEGSDAPGEPWRHLEVFPGVTLLVKVPVSAQAAARVDKLIQYAKNLLKKE